MSKDDRELIERLRGLLAKATPVPWEAQGTQTEGEDRGVGIIGLRLDDAGEPMYTPTNGIVAAALPCPTEIDDNDYTRVEANAALLVAAVNALPTLLTRLEALQAQPVGEDHLTKVERAIRLADTLTQDVPVTATALGHVKAAYEALAALRALTASPPVVEREALADIAAERERQVSAEGWTPEHDNGYRSGQLAKAAACYARGTRQYWPWEPQWWKPKGRRHDLIRAGALIVAEIERLDRATLTKGARDAG